MAEHLSDCFQGHAAVDGLGREGVAELVWVDVADPGRLRDPSDDARNDVAVEATAVEHDEPVDVVGPAGSVLVELFEELVMQWEVAVVVEFADRNVEPVSVEHEHDGIGFEFAELSDSESGSGEHLDHQPADWVGVGCGVHQFRGVGVGQEFGERVVGGWEVAVEDQHPGWGVGVVPFRDAFEERAQRAERESDRDRRQRPRVVVAARSCAEMAFERLHVEAIDIDETTDLGELGGQEAGELAQLDIGCGHAGRAQRQGDLVEVAQHRRSKNG